VTDTPEIAPVAEVAPQEMNGDTASMDAVWDRLQSEPDEPETAAPVEAAPVETETAETETPETVVEVAPAPQDLPFALKEVWADIPETVRDRVVASHRELSGKLASQGRALVGAEPILNVLRDAVRDNPGLSDMMPAEVAQDVFRLANLQGRLRTDPVNVILEVAQNYGALEQLRAHLSGQPAQIESAAMARQLAEMQARVQQLTNPDQIGNIASLESCVKLVDLGTCKNSHVVALSEAMKDRDRSPGH